MTLRSYQRALRERWRLLALVLLLSLGLAVLITAATPKVYQADAQIFVTSNGDRASTGQYDEQAATQAQVTTFSQLVNIPQIVDAVRTNLNLALSEQQLAAKISATAPPQQTLVIIHVQDGSPDTAAAIANQTATEFIRVIEDLKRPTDSGKSAVRLFVTDRAVAPAAPISPNLTLNVALGVILGLLFGVALAVARDVLDNRIKEADQLAAAAGVPTMGVIVDDQKAARHPIATRAGTRNIRAENFRQLRANLQFANVDAHPRVIAVTSSIPTEGKTMVAMNLASTLAEAGFTVCLVDADLRRPTVAKLLGLPSPVGLTSVLIHQLDLDEALQSAGSNLYLLSSGPTPPNPSEVLASSYVRTVIRSLLDKVDYVIIDTAPLLPVADGSEVAALADGTLLVARHRLTTDGQVKRAKEALTRVDANLLGVVLNRVPGGRGSEYGYTYYRADTEKSAAHSKRTPARLRGKKETVSS
ncbi:MAG TPA: polysaccharide biosynthesis tyrosine autokinase [Jatrophihabitans sp.]|uniref:polysaccharide biosynthesis tyrosine autokinase n=1 Tax=Jatrophihabitans sp. TaxID=1932789 RepID=UPI002E0A83D1|nr:polysaccharide biosynthesis tyrosine autokinase [Jatrophihabitans sp.]